MSLLNPLLLGLGLAAVAAPILIHILMRRRRKPVPWAAMRFLLEAYKKQRRRMQLEQLLLLTLRCLLIALVALAIGRPVLAGAGEAAPGGRSVMLLLDNSLTSATITGDSSELDRSKTLAAEVLDTLDPNRGDRAGLVLVAGPAEASVVPPSSDLDAVARLVRNAEHTASSADWAGAVRKATDAATGEQTQQPAAASGSTELVLLSAWRTGSTEAGPESTTLAQTGPRPTVAEPADAAAGNVWIESVNPLRPVQLAGPGASVRQVRVRLARDEPASSAAGTTALTLTLAPPEAEIASDAPRSSTQGRWQPGDRELSLTLPLPELPESPETNATLIVRAEAVTQGVPDAIAADNTARAAVQFRDRLRVGVVARTRFGRRANVSAFEPADWVRAALEPNPDAPSGIEPVNLDPASLDTPRLASLDALVLLRPDLVSDDAWARLAEMARTGKPLIVAPPAEPAASLWADAMADALGVEMTVSREPVELPTPERLDPDFTISDDSPLALLRGELPDLAAAVQIYRRFSIETGERAAPLLATESGSPVAVRITLDNSAGAAVLLAVAADPEWSQLPAKPLFVPLLQELVRDGVGATAPWRTIEAGAIPARAIPPDSVELASADRTVSLAARDDPALRAQAAWRAIDAQGRRTALLIVNHDPDASDTTAQPRNAVAERLLGARTDAAEVGPDERVNWLRARDDSDSPGADAARAGREGRTPWDLPLLALALAIGLGELALARYASHAVKPRDTGRAAGGAR